MRRRPNIRRLGRDQRGATIVEFAVIAMPMCVLLMGGLELGYNSYVRSTLQGALHDAARVAAVENPILATDGDTVEEQVANMIKETVAHVAPNAVVDVDQKSYFEFSSIGEPEKLMTDNNGNGKYDASDEDCFEDANGNGTFDPDSGKSGTNGGADDVLRAADPPARPARAGCQREGGIHAARGRAQPALWPAADRTGDLWLDCSLPFAATNAAWR